jgi:hypothetical protein
MSLRGSCWLKGFGIKARSRSSRKIGGEDGRGTDPCSSHVQRITQRRADVRSRAASSSAGSATGGSPVVGESSQTVGRFFHPPDEPMQDGQHL